MPWNGSGDFTRVHNFSADASASIGVLASRQDAEWANYETGLENCLTRDGQNVAAADLPMGGFKHTGVGVATSVTNYLRADQYIRQMPIYAEFGGTAENMSASCQLALTSLTAGIQVLVSCPSANTTTSVTLGIAGAGTANVVRADGRGPARGQVKGLHRYIHDGLRWILTDPSPISGKRVLYKTADQSVGLESPGTPISSLFTPINWDGEVLNDGGWASASTSAQSFTVPGGIRAVDIYTQLRLNHTDNGTAQVQVRVQNPQDPRFSNAASNFQPVSYTFSASAKPFMHAHFADVSVDDTAIITIYVAATISASVDGGSQRPTWLQIIPRD